MGRKATQKEVRRLMSILLAFVLMLGMTPVMGLKTQAAPENVAEVWQPDMQTRLGSYASLQEAFSAANEAGQYAGIKLLKDLSLSDMVTLSKDMNLFLNGHTLTVQNGAGIDGENCYIDVFSNTSEGDGGSIVSSGTLNTWLDIYSSDVIVEVKAGTVPGCIMLYEGTVNVSGGEVNALQTWGTVNVSGGKVGFLGPESGVTTVTAGTIGSLDMMNNDGSPVVNISGTPVFTEELLLEYYGGDANSGMANVTISGSPMIAKFGLCFQYFGEGDDDGEGEWGALTIEGGYFGNDPREVLEAHSESRKNHVKVNVAEIECYASQTNWAADGAVYPYRIAVSKEDGLVEKAPVAKSISFTGAAQELVTAGRALGGTMHYALGENADTAPATGWSTAIPVKTNVGIYYVWYKVVGDAEHNDSEAECVAASIAKGNIPGTLTGLQGIAPSAKGKADGKITGTRVGMEYATDADFSNPGNVKAVTGTEVTGLTAGDYYVRIAETDNYKAGAAVKVTVAEGPEATIEEATQNVTRENVDEKTEELKKRDAKEMAAELQTNEGAIEALGKLEETYKEKHGITEEEASSDIDELEAGKFVMIGAALNMESGSVGLKAEKASKEDFVGKSDHNNLVAFDLFVVAKNADGSEVDFSKKLDVPVTVTIPVPARFDAATIKILHKLSDGTIETVPHKVNAADGTVTFTVTHFSPFAISGGAASQSMYRMYNPNSGEHFYTASETERDMLIGVGWNYEGIAWEAPVYSDVPVYRLYNPNAGDHHYTTSAGERDVLISLGWNDEGIGWYSDEDEGEVLHRLYNPNAVTGTHHYTKNKAESDYLAEIGWNYEGFSWYGVVK